MPVDDELAAKIEEIDKMTDTQIADKLMAMLVSPIPFLLVGLVESLVVLPPS